jgi:hypothetical protein
MATLAIIDVDIRSGMDEQAREGLLENLGRYKGKDVIPLWINLLRERADLRVVCLAHDLARLDDFLIDVVRPVPGVRATSARLAFDGVVNSVLLTDLAAPDPLWRHLTATTLMIKSEPGRDREVYQALTGLPPHRKVQVVWVLKIFHSQRADIQMLLVGEGTSAISGYVMSWIRTVPGVLDTEWSTALDWQILGSVEDFASTARCFSVPRGKC